MINPDLTRLSQTLGYTFNNPVLLKRALTHCSVGQENNERFEFLGDSILNFVIAEALFKRFPEKTEGQLSRLRAHLVKGETLAEVAAELKLGDYLYLGQGELKSGGFRRASILADALEAVFAAIYLDSGFAASQSIINECFKSRLASDNLHTNTKDPKTRLQEYLQANKHKLPVYELISSELEHLEPKFSIQCSVPGTEAKSTGTGTSRRRAEQAAARAMLQVFGVK